jgi:hypothetical protein
MPLLARSVDLDEVMNQLQKERPVFHSEADFQLAFGMVLHDVDRELGIRMEVRQQGAEYLDLLCFGPSGRTAVEFKYFTEFWQGTDSTTGEEFRLKTHAAYDVARKGFVFDIERLERFCRDRPGTDGLAVILTNVSALWKPPASTRQATRDHEFRIHEDRTIAGTLRWGSGDFPANDRDLGGSYQLRWRDYSALEGRKGIFRWLAVVVPAVA